MSVAPMHAFRAPTAGTGKSYLIDLIGAIATGRICPAVTMSDRPEEAEKRLGGMLLAGCALISIDNVNGELGGDLLCQAIERPLVQVRRLGASDMIEIDNRCCILANGNNLRISGDATRRTLLASLDANMERPELRTFDFDPVEQVLADRGRYVTACLTIVRAYLLAGSPNRLDPLASFGDWSNRVRSALVWLGCADPCASIEAARHDDPELGDLRDLLGAWEADLSVGERYTTRSIIDAAEGKILDPEFGHATADYRFPELRDVLLRVAGSRGGIDPKRFGEWLVRYNGRIVGNLHLIRDTMTSHRGVSALIQARHVAGSRNSFHSSKFQSAVETAISPFFRPRQQEAGPGGTSSACSWGFAYDTEGERNAKFSRVTEMVPPVPPVPPAMPFVNLSYPGVPTAPLQRVTENRVIEGTGRRTQGPPRR